MSFRGASETSEPGIHTPDRGYGFRVASLILRDAAKWPLLRMRTAYTGTEGRGESPHPDRIFDAIPTFSRKLGEVK